MNKTLKLNARLYWLIFFFGFFALIAKEQFRKSGVLLLVFLMIRFTFFNYKLFFYESWGVFHQSRALEWLYFALEGLVIRPFSHLTELIFWFLSNALFILWVHKTSPLLSVSDKIAWGRLTLAGILLYVLNTTLDGLALNLLHYMVMLNYYPTAPGAEYLLRQLLTKNIMINFSVISLFLYFVVWRKKI